MVMNGSNIVNGKIVKIISNLYTVKTIDGNYIDCRARGKFRHDNVVPLVGDYVNVDIKDNYIIEILDRKNSLNRPQISNVDVALIVTSLTKPDISFNLLDKLILVIKKNNIEPVICITKKDLIDRKTYKDLKKSLKYYETIGIKVFYNSKLSKLKKYLNQKIVVLTGQTGAGKSTLLNKLDKSLNLDTNPISDALGRGVHTTRHTEIHEIDNIYFADTPGFSSINLDDIDKENILIGFPEFNNYTCDFKDCAHIDEKNCSVKNAVLSGKILKSRYENYVLFYKEIKK